jgi:hypothetical protein
MAANMKILIILVFTIFVFETGFSQTFVPRGSAAVTNVDQRLKGGLTFYLPWATDTTLNGGLDSLGALLLVIKSGDTSLYMRTPRPAGGGNKWSRMLKSGDNLGGVLSFNTRTGNVTLNPGDITTALGYTPPNPNGTNLQYIAGDGSKITFPTIPAQFNPIQGYGMSITGTYPNKTFAADTSVLFPAVRATISPGSGGITSLNGLTVATQTFATGTAGTDLNISSASTTHTFNLPIVSGTNTGKVTPSLFNTWNAKISNITGLVLAGTNVTVTGSGTSGSPYVINAPSGKNADSIKKLPVDTSTNRNNYVLAFDSINHKWILAPPGSGGGGSGTVNQVNTGLWLTGGPITNTGTIIADSAGMATYFLRRKDSTTTGYQTHYDSDTARTNIYNALNGKQPTGNYITALTGDVVAGGPGSATATIQPNVVTYAKFQAAAGQGLLGATGAGNFGLITLGTNLSMSGSVLNAAGGGGGTPAGSNTQAQYNNSGAFGADATYTFNSTTKRLSADSITTKNFQIGTIAKHADSSVYFGTSITEGNAGVTPQSNRYSTVTANSFNTLEANHGQSGASLQVDMLAKIGQIAPYNYAVHRFIVMEWLANDIINIGNNATWDTAHAGPIYRQIIDTCLARGWPANKIVLLSPGMISPTLWTNATLVRQAQYFAMAQSVATTRGVIFVDLYHSQEALGGTIVLTVDGIHPTNGGAALYAQLIRQSLTDTVNIQSQSVGVNGLSEFNKMKVRIVDTATVMTTPLGIDSLGNLKRYWKDDIIANYNRLPQKQSASIGIYGNVTAGGFGNFGGDVTAGGSGKLGSNVTQLDAVFTAGLMAGSLPGFSLKGSGYSTNQKIVDWWIDDGHLYGRLVPDDLGSATNWMQVNRTGITVNNVAFEHGNTLIGTATDNTSGAKLQVAGNVTMGSANTGELTLVINTASDHHVEFLNYLGENFITGLNTARTAGKPLAFAGSYTAFGYFGGSNTYNEAFRVSTTGNVGVGTTTPAASSLLDITSTTKGFLFPRLNTTQMNAISSPATGLTIWNTDSLDICVYTGSAWLKERGGTSAGGSDSLKVSFVGTGVRPFYVNVDTLFGKTLKGLNSITSATGSDSTINFQLVNDTAIGTAASYYYGTNSAGRRGYYTIPASVNLYNSDGTLTGDRTITGASSSLIISGLSNMTVTSTGLIALLSSSGVNMTGGISLGSMSELSGDQTLTGSKAWYAYTGSGGNTWTLPLLTNNQGRVYFIKNAGSGSVTISRASSDQIYDTSAVSTISIAAGAAVILYGGPSYWYKQ